jgi:hypothetical protein
MEIIESGFECTYPLLLGQIIVSELLTERGSVEL